MSSEDKSSKRFLLGKSPFLGKSQSDVSNTGKGRKLTDADIQVYEKNPRCLSHRSEYTKGTEYE